MDELVEIIAREVARSRNPSMADGKHWTTEVAHYRKMAAQYGATYEDGRSTITDAFREARLCLTALEAKGYGIIGPKRDGVANYADVALQDAQVEHYSGGEKIWIYDDALLLKSLAGNGFSIGPTVLHGKEEKQATRSSEDGRATAPITTGN